MNIKTKIQEVYFMGSCLVDIYYPNAGLRGMQLISKQGIKVIYPKGQTCCAQPAFNSGYRQDALKVARSLMKCFPKDIPIILPSGSCAGMIKHHWSELFVGQKDLDDALNISKRIYELTDFLSNELNINLDDIGEPIKIAIHTSCSCRNEMKVGGAIEDLVSKLENVEVLTQEKKSECCGFGGTFAVKQADISGFMVNDKVNFLNATGATKVVSQDCGCLMNIGGALKKQQLDLSTQHIAEFLWDRTNGTD